MDTGKHRESVIGLGEGDDGKGVDDLETRACRHLENLALRWARKKRPERDTRWARDGQVAA